MDKAEENGRATDRAAAEPDGRGRAPGSRRTQFPPGASANPGGRWRADEPEVPEPEGEAGDGAPAALRDLRWVRRNLGVRCRGTAIQEALRTEARKNPLKFNAEYARLEREFRASRGKPGAGEGGGHSLGSEPDALPRDEGEERVRRLLGELLARARGGEPPRTSDARPGPDVG